MTTDEMPDATDTHRAEGGRAAGEMAAADRTFLVVIDETAEMEQALHYASRRARATGERVALLYVVETGQTQEWAAVEEMIREERRQEAEQRMQRLARRVQEKTGQLPVLHMREGDRREELYKLIEEDESLSILVLGAGTGSDGPGPLVTSLLERDMTRMRIPVVIVPGGLSPEAIDLVT